MKTQFNMEKPTIITAEIAAQDKPAKKCEKKGLNVKVIVISVAAVCIAVTVVAGFLFAFKFQTESTKDIITRTIESRGQKETIEDNEAENTKLYTINVQGITQQVLYDFNRKMRIVKADNLCYVSPMNATEQDVEDMTSDENGYIYKFDSQPVHDKSFLAKSAQELCEGQHLYWAFPSCNDRNITNADDTGMGMEKRAVYRLSCYNCCITSCGWRVCSCRVLRIAVCNRYYCRCYFYFGC